MTEFWFDSNFFIAAREINKLQILKRLFSELRTKYQFKITRRVRNEIKFFDNIIRIYFQTENIQSSPEFRSFCFNVKSCLGSSKYNDEPADQSLAFGACNSSANKVFIVSNDEGFRKAKQIESNLMKSVKIVEPMEFIEQIIPDIPDDSFCKELENLIVNYADHFIKYRLKDPKKPRPIESILQNLLLYSTTTVSAVTTTVLPDNYLNAINRYISSEILSKSDENLIKPVEKYFLPFAKIYSSDITQERDILTRSLYLRFPEIISELNEVGKKSTNGILKYYRGIQELVERKVLNLRIEETIHYYQDCLFEKAFLHFNPLLETKWSVNLSPSTIQDLKLLFGIFQLHFANFGLVEYLIQSSYWQKSNEIKNIFQMLINIKNQNISEDINKFNVEDITLLFNLGLYFCNAGNIFGLHIFDVLFNLDTNKLKNLEWYLDYLKRYILELRINERKISPQMEEKFLHFLNESDLADNTKVKFDRSLELNEMTPLENTNFLYKQIFYFMRALEQDAYYETYCWNDSIRSIVIVHIPYNLCNNLKNVKTLKVLGGNLQTKKISLSKKKNARIIIELDINCKLYLERFKLEII